MDFGFYELEIENRGYGFLDRRNIEFLKGVGELVFVEVLLVIEMIFYLFFFPLILRIRFIFMQIVFLIVILHFSRCILLDISIIKESDEELKHGKQSITIFIKSITFAIS